MDPPEVVIPTGETGNAADSGQLVVHGDALPPPPKKRLNLLNRPPSPKILEPYGDLEPSRCTVHGPGVAGGFIGSTTQVFVTARDAKGVHIREGGHHFTLKLYSKDKKAVVHECEATDHNDGTYLFLFKVDAKGMYEYIVESDGAAVGDSPYGVFFGVGEEEPQAPAFQPPPALTASSGGNIKERIVFVTRMNPGVEADGVRRIFEPCGKLSKCERLLPAMDMWMLHFAKPEGATAAVALNGILVAECEIVVTLASQCGGVGTHPLILNQLQQIQHIQMQEVVTTQMASMLAAQRAAVRATGGDVEEVTDTRKKRVAMSVIQQLRAKLAKTQGEGDDAVGGGPPPAEERPRDLRDAVRERARGRDGDRDRDRGRDRDKDRTRERDRERDRDRERARERERDRDRDRQLDREREKGRDREREREKERDRRAREVERKPRDADREPQRSRERPEHERGRDRDREGAGERDKAAEKARARLSDAELAERKRQRELERLEEAKKQKTGDSRDADARTEANHDVGMENEGGDDEAADHKAAKEVENDAAATRAEGHAEQGANPGGEAAAGDGDAGSPRRRHRDKGERSSGKRSRGEDRHGKEHTSKREKHEKHSREKHKRHDDRDEKPSKRKHERDGEERASKRHGKDKDRDKDKGAHRSGGREGGAERGKRDRDDDAAHGDEERSPRKHRSERSTAEARADEAAVNVGVKRPRQHDEDPRQHDEEAQGSPWRRRAPGSAEPEERHGATESPGRKRARCPDADDCAELRQGEEAEAHAASKHKGPLEGGAEES